MSAPGERTTAPRTRAGGRCKGTLLVNLRAHVAATRGERAWDELLEALPGSDAKALRRPLLVSSWYDVGLWNRVLRLHLETAPDPAIEMRRYARYVAERDLNTVLKLVLSIATPDIIVSRTSMFWSRYFDTGTLTPTHVGPRRWVLAIAGPKAEDEGPAAVTCGDGVSGWVEHALRLAGAPAPSVTHVRCRFQGASECSSNVGW
jgi:hypothetical protein